MPEHLLSSLRKEDLEQAKKRSIEIKEQGETKVFTLQPEKRINGREEILVGARMQGAINSLLPVVRELLKKGYPISFLADQPAEKTLRAEFPDLVEQKIDPLSAVAERDPGLILSGVSIAGGPGIEFYLATESKGDKKRGVKNIPTVWVEDYWKGSIRCQDTYNVFPDVVCTFDEASKDKDIKHLKENADKGGQEMLENTKFIVTGSPAFDELASETKRQREEARVKLHIADDEVLVTYMGGKPPSDLKNLEALIGGLNQIDFGDKKIKFAARIHPAILGTGPLSKYRDSYSELLSKFRSGVVIETMNVCTTTEVRQAADLVVSDFSTEGIKAVFRNKLALFMLFPDLGAKDLEKAIGERTLPIIESGASVGVTRPEELAQSLRDLILDPKRREQILKNQRKHHKLDGKNTERVIKVIEDLLRRE